MSEDIYSQLLKADQAARLERDCLDKSGTVNFPCPDCGDKAVSNYHKEQDRLVGEIICETCKIVLIIYPKEKEQ